MIGRDMILQLDGTTVAVAQGVSVDISVEAETYEPLPDNVTGEDAMWAYYRPGKRSWSISHNGLYGGTTNHNLIKSFVEGTDTPLDAWVCYDESNDEYIRGTVHLEEVSVEAPSHGIVKFNANLVGDNFPELYP